MYLDDYEFELTLAHNMAHPDEHLYSGRVNIMLHEEEKDPVSCGSVDFEFIRAHHLEDALYLADVESSDSYLMASEALIDDGGFMRLREIDEAVFGLVLILHVSVDEDHRGHDLGRRALRFLVQSMRETGRAFLLIPGAPEERDRLIPYYEKMGFTVQSESVMAVHSSYLLPQLSDNDAEQEKLYNKRYKKKSAKRARLN